MSENKEIRGLVNKAKKYQVEAFEKLYTRYFRQVYSYVYFRVGVVPDAEDLTAQTFLRALEAIETYNEKKASFISWLLSIAHNLTIDYYREKKRKPQVFLEEVGLVEEGRGDPEEALINNHYQDLIWKKVGELTEEQQQVIFLKFGLNFSNKEIARALSKTEGSIKALLFRALRMLKKKVEKDERSED